MGPVCSTMLQGNVSHCGSLLIKLAVMQRDQGGFILLLGHVDDFCCGSCEIRTLERPLKILGAGRSTAVVLQT